MFRQAAIFFCALSKSEVQTGAFAKRRMRWLSIRKPEPSYVDLPHATSQALFFDCLMVFLIGHDVRVDHFRSAWRAAVGSCFAVDGGAGLDMKLRLGPT